MSDGKKLIMVSIIMVKYYQNSGLLFHVNMMCDSARIPCSFVCYQLAN